MRNPGRMKNANAKSKSIRNWIVKINAAIIPEIIEYV
jgi:hypothetical protein